MGNCSEDIRYQRTANAFLDDLKGQYKTDIEIEVQAQVIYQVIEESNFINHYKYLLFRAEYVNLILNHFKSCIDMIIRI